MEKDNEINVNGGDYDFGARIYDSRLGRFLSIDPFIQKYPMLSSYCFAANTPIRLIDVFGLYPGDVVITFGGGDFMGTGDKGNAPNIINKVNNQHINQVGGKSESFHSTYWRVSPDNTSDLDRATQSAYDFIKANHNLDGGKKVEGGKIIIEGYSMGGVLANHLAKRLEADKIQVDLLITVDAAAAWETNEVDRKIPSNVKENINIFQTNASSVGSNGAENTAVDPSKTNITNSNYTGQYTGKPGQPDYKEVNHSTIDEISQDRVVDAIVNKLGGVVLPKITPNPNISKSKTTQSDNTSMKKPVVPLNNKQ